MKKIVILLTLFSITNTILADPFTTRGVIILLDTEEKLESDILGGLSDSFGALSQTLLPAIDQKAAPIIVSSSLFKNFIIHKEIFTDFSHKSDQELADKYSELEPFKNPGTRGKIKEYMTQIAHVLEDTQNKLKNSPDILTTIDELVKAHPSQNYYRQLKPFFNSYLVSFEPTEWICRKISDFLYLLIPKNYVPTPTDNTPIRLLIPKKYKLVPDDTSSEYDISPTELTLGLKIDHLDPIENILSFTQHRSDYTAKKLAQDFIENIIKKNRVFVTKNEYKRVPANAQYFEAIDQSKPPTTTLQYPPQRWAFYMSGHGGEATPVKTRTKTIVAGLSIEQLSEFFDFLHSKTDTKFLVFDTCYGGGQNLAEVYKNLNQPSLQKTYPFTIASIATSDNQTASLPMVTFLPPFFYSKPDYVEELTKARKTILGSFLGFKNFFNTLKNEPPINFLEIIKYINPFEHNIHKYTKNEFSNIPNIKYPGLEWSNIIEIPGKIIEITKILASTYSEKVLDVSKYFSKKIKNKQLVYPEAILLSTQRIPFTLKLSLNPDESGFRNAPAFISMLPGNAVHKITGIDAPDFTFSQIVEAFFKIRELASSKICMVETITITNDINNWPGSQPTDNNITLHNVVMFNYTGTPDKDFGSGIYFTYNNQTYKSLWDNGTPPISTARQLQHFEKTADPYVDPWKKHIELYRDATIFPPETSASIFDTGPAAFKEQFEKLLTPTLHNLEADLRALVKSLS
ncbi:MAG: hypothetical protein WC707_05865 [Candidatus Babeliaceae bacterium]|jgi:hypothetical protein